MSAPTKRRHLSYYFSLPVVVTIVFFLVIQLAARQRGQIVAELSDRVAHHEADDATAALRQLAAMPRPPIDVLVAAAASPDQEIAKEAQLLVSGLLRRWSRQIDTGQRLGAANRRLAELAQSLAAQQAKFSSADHRWLAGTARKILRLANRTTMRDAPLVATHCDSILASIAAYETATGKLVERSRAASGHELIATAGAVSGDPRTIVEPRSTDVGENVLRAPAADMSETRRAEPLQTVPRQLTAEDVFASDVATESADKNRSDAAFQSPWRGEWAHPLFRMLPAMPINSSPPFDSEPSSRQPSAAVTEPATTRRENETLAETDSRQLLQRWLTASGSDVLPLDEELARRGFGRLSARLVQQLFSDDADARLRLVDDVLTEPGVDARPWLVLLADDTHADVRLLAVTIMATSDDPALIEKAWQVAISDRDPRIAGLASRLRDRREGSRQR